MFALQKTNYLQCNKYINACRRSGKDNVKCLIKTFVWTKIYLRPLFLINWKANWDIKKRLLQLKEQINQKTTTFFASVFVVDVSTGDKMNEVIQIIFVNELHFSLENSLMA